MPTLRQKIKDTILKLRHATKTISDKNISDLINATQPLTVEKYKGLINNLIDIQKQLVGDSFPLNNNLKQLMDDLIRLQGSSAHISSDRLYRYNTYDSIVRSIPFVNKAITVIKDNIISPDDVAKTSFRYEPKYESLKTNSMFKTAVDQFKFIDDSLQIEEKADEIIYQTLKYGDAFVEIQLLEEEYARLLAKYNIQIEEHHSINLSIYSTTNKLEGDIIPIKEYDLESVSTNPIPSLYNTENQTYSTVKVILRDPRKIIKLRDKNTFIGYLVLKSVTKENNKPKFGQITTIESINSKSEFELNNIITTLAQNIINTLKQSEHIDIDNPYSKNAIVSVLKSYENILNSDISVRFVSEERMVHFYFDDSIYFPYGKSWLDGLEFDAKLYLTDKVATVIHRVARAGDRQVVYIESGVSGKENDLINEVKRQLIKREVAWNESDIDSIPSVVTPFERIYIPRRKGQAFVEFDSLNMGQSMPERMETNTELKKSLLHGLLVPPPFLGIEEFVESKATLTQENTLFARTILSLQKKFTEKFSELFQKLYIIGFKETPEYNNMFSYIRVTFPPPTNILLSSLEGIYSSVTNIANALADFGVPKEYIAKKFIPNLDWNEIEKFKAMQNNENSEEESSEMRY